MPDTFCTNKATFPWFALFVHVRHPTGHIPAEVVVAQPETVGVHFCGRELPPSQRRGVPVDALCSRVADAPRASVPLALSHHTLLIGVCWSDRLRVKLDIGSLLLTLLFELMSLQ